jgi:hypothetical protein
MAHDGEFVQRDAAAISPNALPSAGQFGYFHAARKGALRISSFLSSFRQVADASATWFCKSLNLNR